VDHPVSHAEFEQLSAGYVLGALEPDDEHAFTDHLAGCHVCQTGVRELEQVVGELPHAVPTARPPRSLRATLRRRVGYRRRRRNLLVVGPRVKRVVVARVALALGLLGLFALSFWNMSLRNQVAVQGRQLGVFESAARVLNDPQARRIRLAAQGGRTGRGTVLSSSARDEGVLVVEGLSGPVPGRVYQLWVLPPGAKPEQAQPGRTWISSDAPAVIRFDGLQLDDTTGFMVTTEPRGGSSAPTLPAVLVSALEVPTGSS
jgi:anti-sigma-K factor RskA